MPALSKYRKIKRPTVVIKKKALKRHSYDKKLTNSSYEKLKSNNIALARALNKQKQEVQYLYRQTVDLTAQNQELQCLGKRHLEGFSNMLKSSKEAMDLMVKATHQIVCVISACNNFLTPETTNLSRVSAAPSKRDSMKCMSPSKSPARGVVQPMVSGHAIAQPVITLSRIRIAVAPNVSDIEESAESSPALSTRNQGRISQAVQSRGSNSSMAPLMPQRIRMSSPIIQEESRVSDEPRRRSNRGSSRYQKRKSRNSTRHSSEQTSRSSVSNIDVTIKSPRVSLEDVSRLMQNSQRINVRSLMQMSREERATDETHESPPSSVSPSSSPTYQFDRRARNNRKRNKNENDKPGKSSKLVVHSNGGMNNSGNYEDDPLEGTSWSYSNGSQNLLGQVCTNGKVKKNARGSLENCMRALGSLSMPNRVSLTMINHQDGYGDDEDDGDEDDDNEDADDEDERCQVINFNQQNNDSEDKTTFTALIARNICTPRGRVRDFESVSTNEQSKEDKRGDFKECMRALGDLSMTNRMSLTMINHQDVYSDNDDDDDDEEEDGDEDDNDEGNDDDNERCQMINFNQQDNNDDDDDEDKTTFTTLFTRNVCTSRGRIKDFDPDEFTMMRVRKEPQPWTMDDIEIPVIEPQTLENPLPRNELTPEPEVTKTIQINTGNPQQEIRQSANSDLLPNVTLNTSVTMPFIDTAGRVSEDETTKILIPGRKRMLKPLDSSSESDSPLLQVKKNAGNRHRTTKRRDPKSAKVVLEKLKEPKPSGKKGANSPKSKRSSQDCDMNRTSGSSFALLNSDSESSNASIRSRQSSGRPRRQKAPVNFREPSLVKKLRRE